MMETVLWTLDVAADLLLVTLGLVVALLMVVGGGVRAPQDPPAGLKPPPPPPPPPKRYPAGGYSARAGGDSTNPPRGGSALPHPCLVPTMENPGVREDVWAGMPLHMKQEWLAQFDHLRSR